MCGGQKQGLWVGMRGNERLWLLVDREFFSVRVQR